MLDDIDKLNSELKDLSRITVVNDNGVAYEEYDLCDIQYSIQDHGKTLKLFVKKSDTKVRD